MDRPYADCAVDANTKTGFHYTDAGYVCRTCGEHCHDHRAHMAPGFWEDR